MHTEQGEEHDQVTQLDMPANVMVAANDDQQLTVSWDMVEGASGYQVTWDPASQGGDQSHNLSSEATSYTIGGLQPATTYSIGVTALGTPGESMDSMTATAQGMTNPVAYDLLLSHEAASGTITCPERSSPRDQCAGDSEFAGGDFEEVNALLNGGPDKIDKATIRAVGQRVRLHAAVKTDSPAETTTVTLRIANSNGTIGLDGDPGITYETSGLNAPGVRSIEDGTLDIQIRDDASRVFDVYVTCQGTRETLTGTLDIEVRDDDQRLVAQTTIMCAPPEEMVVTEEITACYTISGMPDQGDDPDTNVVEGEDIELFTTDKSVQLIVSSYEKVYHFTTTDGVRTLAADYPKDCPDWPQSSVFIRLVDQPGAMPMVDDDEGFVDENGLIDDHGAVTGVSSGGELMLDIMDTVDVEVPGQDASDMVGVRRGTFRVFTPTDVEVGDRFFVELYDNLQSDRIRHQNALTGMEQDYERVVYCSSPATAEGACMVGGPPEAVLTAPTSVMAMVDDSDPGAASVTVTWTDGAEADRHVVFLFDSNLQLTPDRIAGNQTDGMTTFNNVPSGTYTAVVVAVEDGPTGNAMNIESGFAFRDRELGT